MSESIFVSIIINFPLRELKTKTMTKIDHKIYRKNENREFSSVLSPLSPSPRPYSAPPFPQLKNCDSNHTPASPSFSYSTCPPPTGR